METKSIINGDERSHSDLWAALQMVATTLHSPIPRVVHNAVEFYESPPLEGRAKVWPAYDDINDVTELFKTLFPEGCSKLSLCEELYMLASPKISRYKCDLQVDQSFIQEHPGVPFLHFTRDAGTHLISLIPAEQYPKPGNLVTYIFESVDRQRLLETKQEEFESIFNSFGKDISLILFYDGSTLKTITKNQAQRIIKDYKTEVKRRFKND